MGRYRVPVHMLEEDNYSLRVQVNKLQTALHKVTEQLETQRDLPTARSSRGPPAAATVRALAGGSPPRLAAAARSPEKARQVLAAARTLDHWADVSEAGGNLHEPPPPRQPPLVARRVPISAAVAPRSPSSPSRKTSAPERRLAAMAKTLDQWADVANDGFELALDDEVGVAWGVHGVENLHAASNAANGNGSPGALLKPGQHRAENFAEDRIARARRRGAALARAVAQGQSVRDVLARERATGAEAPSTRRARSAEPRRSVARVAATPAAAGPPAFAAFERWAEPPRAPLTGDAMRAAEREVTELSDRLAKAEAKLRRMEVESSPVGPKRAPAASLEVIGREAEAAAEQAETERRGDRPGRGRATNRQLLAQLNRQRAELELLRNDVVGNASAAKGSAKVPWRPGGVGKGMKERSAVSPQHMEVHAHDGGAPLRASYSTTLINGVRAADRAASQIMMANRPASAKKQKQREAARLLSMGLSAAP